MSGLKLVAESTWVSPWVFHVMTALEEQRHTYELELVPLPIPKAQSDQLATRALIGKVPILVHGDVWLTESSAISEYLTDRFPQTPLFPTDVVERARARQVMSYLRTSLMALRGERPTTNVFGSPVVKPFSDKAALDAAELLRVATSLVKPGATQMFATWSVADADLALALMRMVKSGDPVPAHVADYAHAQWARPSIQRFLAHVK